LRMTSLRRFSFRATCPRIGIVSSAATSRRFCAPPLTLPPLQYPAPHEDVAWDKLGFGLESRDTRMVVAHCKYGGRWSSVRSEPYGALSLEPAASVLNYGQGIFEGIKAFRTTKGRIVLFRPHKNAQRMAEGARRFEMPPVPTQLFLEAVEMIVKENAEWVPPVDQGALYLRPLLLGTGPDLGVKPSSSYTFVIFCSPVGSYFKSAVGGGVRLKVCLDHQRAAPMGIGHVKAAGNYAPCFRAQREAKGDGYSDIIYLDVGAEYIEEAAASNFFCVDENNVVRTPQLGQILAGVTRDSVINLARRLGDKNIHLQVGRVSLQQVMASSEAFLTGTGVSLSPVEHISTADDSVDFDAPGPVTKLLQTMLLDIQMERTNDRLRWLHDPWLDGAVAKDSFLEPQF